MDHLSREEKWVLEEKYGGDMKAAGFARDRKRLASGEPTAYVIGWQPFLGLRIYMDSHPLIPRPETEWWVNELVNGLTGAPANPLSEPDNFLLKISSRSRCRAPHAPQSASRSHPTVRPDHMKELRFLDLCAGSGAIGCAALAKLPNAKVYFGELDPQHENTIYRNIRENGLDESRADVRTGDLFEPFNDLTFDVIAANPPYVPEGRALPESVADFEPREALYAGEDGLALIRRIAAELPARLNPDGVAWIECDEAHATEASEPFTARGMQARVVPDQYGVDRVVVVSFP